MEGDKAWFLGGEVKGLFEVDLIENRCQLVDIIPELEVYARRTYPMCMKFDNRIFCLPDIGKCIWIYDLQYKKWENIIVNDSENIRVGIRNFWRQEEYLWCVANGLRQIVKVNLKKAEIEQYWDITGDSVDMFAGSVMKGDNIYIVSSENPQIYKFNIKSGETEIRILPDIKDKFLTISYDGKKFWLSGLKWVIYVWDECNNTIEFLKNFPDKFGSYSTDGKTEKIRDDETVVFISNVCLGDNIFFLSSKANQILYINKHTYETNILEVDNEDETPMELKKQLLHHKYLFEYIRKNRYIGIFSLKNQQIFEIDTIELKDIHFNIVMNKDIMQKIEQKNILDFIETVEISKSSESPTRNGRKIYSLTKYK